MTEDHIKVLEHVAKNQPIQIWAPKNFPVAVELIEAGLIKHRDDYSHTLRRSSFKDVRLALGAREKIKEWQDAIDEKKPSYRIVSAFKKTSTIIGTGVGFVVGGFLGVVGSEAAHRLMDRIFSKETTPIQKQTLQTQEPEKPNQSE